MSDTMNANRRPPTVAEHAEAQEAAAMATQRTRQRSERRAAAVNAVDLARRHKSEDVGQFTQSEADVIMAIMELLDRIADA
jgi:hypothetical protein